jgi:hypothetical protein
MKSLKQQCATLTWSARVALGRRRSRAQVSREKRTYEQPSTTGLKLSIAVVTVNFGRRTHSVKLLQLLEDARGLVVALVAANQKRIFI